VRYIAGGDGCVNRHRRPNSYEDGYQDHKSDLRHVKTHGIIFLMSLENRYVSAEQRREISRSRILLAKIKQHESVAIVSESGATERLRTQYHALYVKFIGIEPEFRTQFRDALQRIMEGEYYDVDAAIEHIHFNA
jgi:hypothetical protein